MMMDRLSPGIWVDRHGEVHFISSMETAHLENVLRLLFKWREEARKRDAVLFLWLLDRKIEEIEDELVKRD